MRAAGQRPSFEVRAGALAALVLVVLTGGTASAVALEHAARTAPAVAVVTASAAVEPRVFVEDDLTIVASWAVPATTLDLLLTEAAPPAPPAPAPAAPAAATSPSEPVEAAAPADPLCRGDGWQQRRGEAALQALRRPSDAAPFTVAFEPGRAGVIGLATVHEGRLQVFVRSCSELSTSLLQHVVAHELGHLLDGARMSEAAREQWKAARGIPADVPWYGCNGCTDFATPAGDFAEVYAQWQTGAGSNRSQLASAPSSGQLADLAARFF